MEDLIMYSKSVLNTSKDDIARFNELLTFAAQLKTVCAQGEAILDGYVQILGDIWYAFFSASPSLLDDTKEKNLMQYDFLKNVLELEDYQNWHYFTQSDPLLSVLTTITIGEQLTEHLKQDQQTKKAAIERKVAKHKLAYTQKKLEQLAINELDSKSINNQTKFLYQSLVRMAENAQKEIEGANQKVIGRLRQFHQQLASSILSAHPQVVEKKAAIVSLSSLVGKKIEQVSLKEQFNLAEHITTHPTLKQIADMAGRFKKIANKKAKSKVNYMVERRNITLNNELNRLIPLELAQYVLPSTHLDFLKRYAEAQTLVFDTKGKDRRGKGPIIICMDESSSMTSIKTESKAFCLALLMIAKRQKRDFAIIPFALDIGEVQFFLKGRSSTDQLIHFSKQFLGGGTNYEKPLRESLTILTQSKFKGADVLFVTDGSSFLSTDFINEFNQIKRKRQFECTSIILTNRPNTIDLKLVHRFSDKIIEVNDLTEAADVFSGYLTV